MALLEHMRRYFFLVLLPVSLWVLTGCTTIRTEHHIVLDHNITIRMEKAVEEEVGIIFEDFDIEGTESSKEETPE